MSVSEHSVSVVRGGNESPLRIVRLLSEHIAVLLPLEHASYPDPWTQGMFRQELKNIHSYFYVGFLGDLLTGYAGFWLVAGEAHITKVTVDEEVRCRGYGLSLMEFLLEKGPELGATTFRLEVRQSNVSARRLYERLGFSEIGRRDGYYTKSKETAVVMQRSTEVDDTNGRQ